MIECRVFAHELGEALASPTPATEIRKLLHHRLANASPRLTPDCVQVVAERLDAGSDDGPILLRQATAVRELIEESDSIEVILALLEVLFARDRFVELIRKYSDGIISRTSFLGFVSSQNWPGEIRNRAAQLSGPELRRLSTALEIPDSRTVQALLIHSGGVYS